MTTRNVVLTEHQDELIASLVKHGRYQNASEVLRAGLRLVEQQDRENEAKVTALLKATHQGWDDLDAGRYDDVTSHPELGDGVITWHLALSRSRSRGSDVRRPRHFLVCRREDEILVAGRLLHDAMDLRTNVIADMDWS